MRFYYVFDKCFLVKLAWICNLNFGNWEYATFLDDGSIVFLSRLFRLLAIFVSDTLVNACLYVPALTSSCNLLLHMGSFCGNIGYWLD